MDANQRSRRYVDPEVQGALARRLVVHWLAYTLVASGVAVGLAWMANPFAPLGEVLAEAWWGYAPLLLTLVALVPVFVVDSIRLSHRFSGPVYRFRGALERLASGGPVERLTFRESDFWRGLAEDFNRVADRVGAPTPTGAAADPE